MQTLYKRKFIVGLFPLLASFLFLTGCKKNLLDTVPATSISQASAYSTPDKVLAELNGIYAQLSNAGYLGGRLQIFIEQRGDEFSQNDGNNATGANVWNQSISSSGDFVNNVWVNGYAVINAANLLIDNLGTSSVVADSVKTQYIAEAKFLRAISYFYLVQIYAKPYQQSSESLALPLRLKGNSAGGQNDFAFSKVSEVYTQIIKDLDEAEIGLSVSLATNILNVSRAHKASAIALKTRVYLAKGDYVNVVKEAGKLIPATAPYQYTAGATVHKLESSINNVFLGSYIGVESIFTIPFINTIEAPGVQAALSYNYLTPVVYLNNAGIYSDTTFSATSTDARKTLITSGTSGLKLLNKFKKTTSPYNDYVPIIRYAEILLNYAEAAAETGDLTTALNILNAVRKRSDPNYVFISGVADKQQIISTILNERRIELLGEGFRSLDLLRRVQNLPAKNGNAGSAPLVAATATNYIWPIPTSELVYNKLAPR